MNSLTLTRSLDQPVSVARRRSATGHDPIPVLGGIFSPLVESDCVHTVPRPERSGPDEWVTKQIRRAHLMAVTLR